MKLLVVVTALVACGTSNYDDLLNIYDNGCLLPCEDQHLEDARRFLWRPGTEKNAEDDDDGKTEENYQAIRSLSNESTQSLKFNYIDELIPFTPGDNSHYVEGNSRYIWMPDGNGAPRLVDLIENARSENEERSVADTEYWLYTRQNPSIPQELSSFHPKSFNGSNFQPSRPIIVLVHGWLSDGHDNFNTLMKNTFLEVQDVNVIVVDWRNLAKSGYGTAVQAVPEVGLHIAIFLSWLTATFGSSWTNIHLIGFSLGAHIAGSAGRFAGGRPGRVTGLDPAGPLFHGNPDNLSPIDGQYVEAIHTDGDRLGHFGSLAQVDFYVNGGRNPQPGCLLSTCSHSRVVELFAATVKFNHLIGSRCRNILEAERAACEGDSMKMGNAVLNKRGNGLYGVNTVGAWPY